MLDSGSHLYLPMYLVGLVHASHLARMRLESIPCALRGDRPKQKNEQNRTNRTEQNEQNRTEQNRTEQDSTQGATKRRLHLPYICVPTANIGVEVEYGNQGT